MRTAVTLKRLSVLCAGAMLFACADLSDRFAVPEQRVARRADDAYLLGRNHHLAHRYEDAIRSYRAALAADPQHVNARNGLATIYAERRAFTQAIPIWRSLTDKITLSSGPGSAYLFGNLGYAYFLNGEYENAVVALEKACLLDPMNHNAWYHLGESLQKLGNEQRAKDMFRQAEALQGHDLRADYAAAGGTAVPAIAAAVKAPERRADEWAANQIVTRPDGLLELRRVPPVPAAATASAIAAAAPVAPSPAPQAPEKAERVAAAQTEPVPVPLAPPKAPEPAVLAPQSAMLEIRNGNGVTGMAKSLSRQMGDPNLKVVRLTNEKGFNVPQTRVEYQAGFRPAAQRLAQRFDNAAVVEVSNCKKSDMRLVIGRDIARPKFALRPLAEPANGPVLADTSGVGKPD
jgi:tetratricopeptide (TPR) repeat protein